MDIARFLRAAFYRTPLVAASTTVQLIQLGCLFFIFAPPRDFNFDQNLAQNTADCFSSF